MDGPISMPLDFGYVNWRVRVTAAQPSLLRTWGLCLSVVTKYAIFPLAKRDLITDGEKKNGMAGTLTKMRDLITGEN